MNRFILATMLLSMYVLFSAKSCSEEDQDSKAEEQAKIEATRDSIMAVVESESLSQEAKNSLNYQAQIRLADFEDYLTIISDTVLAFSFRAQAKQMAYELFFSDSCLFLVRISDGRKLKISLKELVEIRDYNLLKIKVPKIDSIWLMKGLQPISDTIFAGKIGFSLETENKSYTQSKNKNSLGNIDFFAVKRQKKFGKDTLKVWTILFGNGEFYATKLE